MLCYFLFILFKIINKLYVLLFYIQLFNNLKIIIVIIIIESQNLGFFVKLESNTTSVEDESAVMMANNDGKPRLRIVLILRVHCFCS